MKEFEQIVEEIERQRPGDMARLKSLMRRSDALVSAMVAVADAEYDGEKYEEAAEEVLEVLSVMREEAHREFVRARRDLGIPGPR